MSISKTESLKKLISSLDKSEKRHFSIYARRLSSNNNVMFIKLFKLLETRPESSDDVIQNKLGLKDTQSYANIKRHLFSVILQSLMLLYAKKNPMYRKEAEYLYANILKEKTLYDESLHFLKKGHIPTEISQSMNKRRMFNELEALVGGQLKTSPFVDNKGPNTLNSQDQEHFLEGSIDKMRLDFRKIQFAINKRESELRYRMQDFAIAQLDQKLLTQRSKAYVFLFKAFNAWSCLDHRQAYRQSLHCIRQDQLNESKLDALYQHMNYRILLHCSFYYNRSDKYTFHLQAYLNAITYQFPLDILHNQLIYMRFCFPMKLRAMIMEMDFSRFDEIDLEYQKITNNKLLKEALGAHCETHYLRACVMAYKGSYEACLDLLNELEENLPSYQQTEYLPYIRLVHILCHYRLNNFLYVSHLLNTVRSLFNTYNKYNRIIEWTLSLTRKGVKAMNFGIKDDIEDTCIRMSELRYRSYDSASFYYFSYIDWFKSIKADITTEQYALMNKNVAS